MTLDQESNENKILYFLQLEKCRMVGGGKTGINFKNNNVYKT